MSSRALRKAQREREEHETLRQLERDEDAGSEEDQTVPIPAKKSAFAMLDEGGEDTEDSGDEAQDDGIARATDPVQSTPSTQASKKKKKKKKKAKQPQAALEADGDNDLDDIDKALKQLSTNGNATLSGATSAADTTAVEATKLLSIDTNHLHAQNEVRRLFGRAALEQIDDEAGPNANNRRQQRQQAGLAQALRGRGGAGGRAGGLSSIALKRNIFVQGKEEWPVATGGGLGMEVEEKRADGTVLYRFVHNRIYQDVQAQFNMAVESMDPNQLVVLLQHNPYHISTLLQVSEIAKQENDHTTSGDLLERALFSCGRAVHSTFAKNLAEGKARLDFARPENREFWLASWRYMQNLTMRATWRTVYEWAKLLLSLSPEEDPYGMWLVLDQYALRSKQELDFLNISRIPTFKEVHNNMPSIQFSQGLAESRAGNPSKGKQALFTAVGRFPWVAFRLFQGLEADAPPAVWGKEPRTEKEKLHSEVYATRAKDLWNTPEASALLLEIASAIPPDTSMAPVDEAEISTNEARHVLLSDTPALISLIPRKFTAALMSSSDPLPPANNNPSYTLASTASLQGPDTSAGTTEDALRELHGLYNFFGTIFPWFRQRHGADGDTPVEEQPDEATVAERIRESGVDDAVFMERTRRLVELQERLGNGELRETMLQAETEARQDRDAERDLVSERLEEMMASGRLDEIVRGSDDEGDARARVEDAEDAGD